MSGLSSPRRERNQIEKLKLGPQDWMGMTFRNLIGKRCWLSWCLGKGWHHESIFLLHCKAHLTENVSVTLSFLSPLSSRSSMLSSSIPPKTFEFSMNLLKKLIVVTWKRLRLHTWVFSYFPKERLVTIAGLSSLKDQAYLKVCNYI